MSQNCGQEQQKPREAPPSSLATRSMDSCELQSVKRIALFAPFFSPSPTLKPVAVQS